MPRKSKAPDPGPALMTPAQWDAYLDAKAAEYAENPEHPDLIGKPEGNPVQIRPAWDPNPDDWEQGVQRNADRWARGVANPRANFKTAALASNDAWKTQVTQAVSEDRFRRGMEGVNEDEAIATAQAVGASGYAQGATIRKGKFARRVEEIKPALAAVTSRVRQMPARTDAEREARALEQIRGARAAGRTRQRRA